ncbi:hypothetical protein B0J11DRAFT_619644 [Dendryphion nanum]|uniref:Secreted protein n=1 Tax=Dendryphion nanum TaxID=256645 RepID=A0A9P9D2Z9_9PLEO|nr:hypothetical protein B0J11DRAFT_619644 [Dendryphion nanum]
MKTSNTNILFVLSVFAGLYSDVVTARPEPEKLIARAVNCNALTVVLNKIPALGTPATSFCSSYLKIPLATTVTQTEKPTTTLTVPVTTTSIDPNCIAPRVKRQPTAIRLDGRKVAGVPVALASFAAAELTSACGCLNLKPKVTVTTTTTEPTLVSSIHLDDFPDLERL